MTSEPAAPAPSSVPVQGLVLSGGASARMGQDKALLVHAGVPQLEATFRLLSRHVQACFVSMRQSQADEPLRARFPAIFDMQDDIGPAAGLLAAHHAYPTMAWLVVACDLPLLHDATLARLLQVRDDRHVAVAYRSACDGLPEPLCALWEPAALSRLDARVRQGRHGLREVLLSPDVRLLPAVADGSLDNLNTPQERAALLRRQENART